MNTNTVKKQLMRSPFIGGAVVLLAWFLWQSQNSEDYIVSEWVIFYVISLLSWAPAANWLKHGAGWVPAAELFFFLHLPYYVIPFLSSREEFIVFEPDTRFKTGLVVALFLFICWVCYGILFNKISSKDSLGFKVLDRKLEFGPSKNILWFGMIAGTVFTVSTQAAWVPDLGTYFNTIRTLIQSVAGLSVFILFYEMGDGKLRRFEEILLLIITVMTFAYSIASGFLIGGAMQIGSSILAFTLGKKKLPILIVCFLILLLSFLHLGKGKMREEFWVSANRNNTTGVPVLNIFQIWLAASWSQLITGSNSEEKSASLVERGSLLQYLGRVVDETPDVRPFMGGLVYEQSIPLFIPRFLWPGKPRASTPDETLAIYYDYQTEESVNYTAVGLGRISEAWASFGWLGILLIGVIMGAILYVPTWLTNGATPQYLRFLLAVPFILFATNLEAGLGPATNSLAQGLLFGFLCLWLISKPAWNQQATYWVRKILVLPAPVKNSSDSAGLK